MMAWRECGRSAVEHLWLGTCLVVSRTKCSRWSRIGIRRYRPLMVRKVGWSGAGKWRNDERRLSQNSISTGQIN